MSMWERLFRDVKQWNATGIAPWDTEEYKARESAEFEADGPHFQCDGCLRIVPTYLGRYPHEGRELCHSCYEPVIDGEEWKI